MSPEKGDLVQVDWVDIQEDVTGDPEKATIAYRTSYGIFWSRRPDPEGVEILVTTTTVDRDHSGDAGYCAYPIGCVRSIQVIKKARKGRKVKANGTTTRARKAQPPSVVSGRDRVPLSETGEGAGGSSRGSEAPPGSLS